MSFQCSNAVQHPEIPHERVAVAHTACSACTVRGLDRAEGSTSENFLAATMPGHALNEYRDTEDLGFDDKADAALAMKPFPSIPAHFEAASMLTSADELTPMSFAD
ncbi:MAG: hypothetical protein Q9195_005402 [Heterodermia aff. obscurata]